MALCLIFGFALFSWLLSSFFFRKICFKLQKLTSGVSGTPCSRIESLVLYYKNRHRLLDWYTDLLSRSNALTIIMHRLGAPRTVVTANPENVEYILKKNFVNFPKGRPFTELLGDFLGMGIFNVDGDKWSIQRKIASHEFSAKSLREFVVKVLEEEVESRLIPILENVADKGGILDMQEVLRRFGFDTICKVTLGMDPCCLDLSQAEPPLSAAFDTASEKSAVRGATPVYAVWKVKKALNVGSERDLREAVDIVHASVDEMIRAKKLETENAGAGDLLSRFLEAGMDGPLVRDMAISFLMAGRDTTSAALTWLFWLLTSHREIERRTVEEIDSLQNGGKKLGFDDLKEMNFVKACLCETMRLYPPVVWDSKHAAKDDVLPDGTPVYRGNRVTYFQYGMGRMEKLWGEDRLEFKPDRWFDESGDLENVSPYKFPVFQAGPRVCLGKEMAFIQMKYVVASLLSRFEFTPVQSDTPVLVPLLTAYMAGGFRVRVRRREMS